MGDERILIPRGRMLYWKPTLETKTPRQNRADSEVVALAGRTATTRIENLATDGSDLMKDLTEKLMAYEQGALSEAEEIELFQYLLDSGLCWTLQGHYGRQATRLMQAGLIRPKGE